MGKKAIFSVLCKFNRQNKNVDFEFSAHMAFLE